MFPQTLASRIKTIGNLKRLLTAPVTVKTLPPSASDDHVNRRFLNHREKLLPPSTSELNAKALPMAVYKCAEHT